MRPDDQVSLTELGWRELCFEALRLLTLCVTHLTRLHSHGVQDAGDLVRVIDRRAAAFAMGLGWEIEEVPPTGPSRAALSEAGRVLREMAQARGVEVVR